MMSYFLFYTLRINNMRWCYVRGIVFMLCCPNSFIVSYYPPRYASLDPDSLLTNCTNPQQNNIIFCKGISACVYL